MTRKPANSFFLYCQENRSCLQQQFPNFSNSDITSLLAERWRNLRSEEKQLYTTISTCMRQVSKI